MANPIISKDELAERGALASIFDDPEIINEVSEILTPEDFYEVANQTLYALMLIFRETGRPIHPIGIASELAKNDELKTIGGIMYITELTNPSSLAAYATDAVGYALIIKEHADKRKLQILGDEITRTATTGSGFSASEALTFAEENVFKISNSAVESSGIKNIGAIFDETVDDIEEAGRNPEGVAVGVPSGFIDLDRKTAGFHKGQIVIIAARPAVGKVAEGTLTIPTPTGYTTFADIEAGDEILGADGKTYHVVKAHPMTTDLDSYEITFSDKSKVVVGADHEWYTETRAARKSRRTSILSEPTLLRGTVLSKEKIDILKTELGATSDDDVYTVFELAQLMRLPSASTTLIAVAEKLASVGQTFLTGTTNRKAKLYNSNEIYSNLLKNDKRIKIHSDAIVLNKITNLVHSSTNDSLSIRQIVNELFPNDDINQSVSYIHKLITKAKITPVKEEFVLTSFTEKSPRILYNKKELISAYLTHSSAFQNDQRHKNIYGSVKTTLDIMETLTVSADKRWNHSIPLTKPINLPEAVLPIHPYALGAWLGDGYAAGGTICGIDHEIKDFIVFYGYNDYSERTPQREYNDKNFRIWNFSKLNKQLKESHLSLSYGQSVGRNGSTKHIPMEYLRGSIQQRRELLAGLMDTDGTVMKNSSGVQFDNTNKAIIDGVYDLACGLGYRPMITENDGAINGLTISPITNIPYKKVFTVFWSTDDDVFKISRKVELHRKGVALTFNEEKNNRRYIVAINKVPNVPMRCITVDSPDHLFLVGKSMIPTHNSTIAVDIARHASLLAGKSVLMFSLEMDKKELLKRVISAQTRIPLQKIRTGDLTREEWKEFMATRQEIQNSYFFIDDTPKVSLGRIRSAAIKQKMRPEGLDLIIVDYLQLMETSSRRNNGTRENEVSELSRGFKILAKELELPIIVLSQLNRGPEQRSDKTPVASDLRESGSLEQDADVILLLNRPEIYDENDRPGEADLIIAKQRNGPTGKIILIPMLEISKFANGGGIIASGIEVSGVDDETPF